MLSNSLHDDDQTIVLCLCNNFLWPTHNQKALEHVNLRVDCPPIPSLLVPILVGEAKALSGYEPSRKGILNLTTITCVTICQGRVCM